MSLFEEDVRSASLRVKGTGGRLNIETVSLPAGFQVVCAFVNDRLDSGINDLPLQPVSGSHIQLDNEKVVNFQPGNPETQGLTFLHEFHRPDLIRVG